MKRIVFPLAGSLGVLGLACIISDETTILSYCGEEWASNTENAVGWNGEAWEDIKKNNEWIEGPMCITTAASEDADDSMSQIYATLQATAISACESRAGVMGLTMDDCSSNVSAPAYKKDCAMNVDDCNPAVGDDGETGGDDGEDDGLGDQSTEIECDGNTCVLSDQLITDLLAAPESTWDEEGYELELVNVGGRDGWEITGIAADTFADQLGFQDDDLFLEVDGIELDSFAALLIAATHALSQDSVRVKYQRSTSTLYKTFVRVCDGYQNYTTATYDWFDLSSVGTGTSVTDDGEVNVSLPFGFQFYGAVYNEIWVGGNGAIRFNSGDVGHTNASIPSSASTSPDIALFWDDLNPSSAGDAYYYSDTTNGRFIVSWEGVPHYSNIGESDLQIHLYENGRIEFHYQDANFGNSSYNHGKSATVGIQDHVGSSTSTNYRQITYNTAWETGMDGQGRAFDPDCN